ncbi:hypothetical protein [Thorsellia kenyensis]|uniref:Uncharacterized protein n=1 Tax=Thorsellia kenyensis TaxID=1549888 RepID=A0ABV6C7F7_9GAMM
MNIKAKSQQITEMLLLIFLMAGIILVGNLIGYSKPIIPSIIAMLIIALIAGVGYLIGLLPYFKLLPNIVWISFLGIYLSSPFFPWQQTILFYANNISFASVSTPVLAFAGLAVGKDLGLFKQLSWKIIPVAVAVFSGTFIFSAILAHFTLNW